MVTETNINHVHYPFLKESQLISCKLRQPTTRNHKVYKLWYTYFILLLMKIIYLFLDIYGDDGQESEYDVRYILFFYSSKHSVKRTIVRIKLNAKQKKSVHTGI